MKNNITQNQGIGSSVKQSVRGRERLLSIRIGASSLFSTSIFALAALLALSSVLSNSESHGLVSVGSLGWRDPASRPFPNVSPTSDVDDIIQDYEPYLQFVAAVGKDVDPKNARLLAQKWVVLKKSDKNGAARFLKLLKFEMDQHLQLTGGSSVRMHSDSPAVRKWVKRFIRDWYREADEQLFRTYALKMSAKNQLAKAE